MSVWQLPDPTQVSPCPQASKKGCNLCNFSINALCISLNCSQMTNVFRVVMPGTKLQEHSGSDKAWVWSTMDFATEEHRMELFCLKLPSPASKLQLCSLSLCFQQLISSCWLCVACGLSVVQEDLQDVLLICTHPHRYCGQQSMVVLSCVTIRRSTRVQEAF